MTIDISIEEALDGAQTIIDHKIAIYCNCDRVGPHACPQGKAPGSDRCMVWVNVARLTTEEVSRLTAPQR